MNPLDSFDLRGKVALVTGGAGILGQQFAAGLATAGAQVAVVDMQADAAQAVADRLGPQAAGFACDVADPCAIQRRCHLGRLP